MTGEREPQQPDSGPSRDPLDYQELRMALAMSGGLSLAIWMGGVAMETYRMVRSDPLLDPATPTDELSGEVYGGLLELTRSTPRVDIVAGASAGGLNGALLAMALVHRSDLEMLRSLWLDKAGLSRLLRGPLDADPPSLLKGDEYFLPELRSAFEALQRGERLPPDDVPIRLIMTTTLLTGDIRTFADELGSLLPDVVHTGQFLFRRGAGIDEDDFAREDLLDRLALAARSTASFPGAFEPSYVPIGESPGIRSRRPDMARNVDFTQSRFVVDGGVLVNKPIGPAIRAILAQPARDQTVRRVFAYVVPDPGAAAPSSPEAEGEAPSLGRTVLGGLVTVPRAESVARDLKELTEHNRRARGQQLLRDRLIGPDAGGANLPRLARELFPTYRRLRAVSLVEDLLARTDPLTVRTAGLGDEGVRILRWMVGRGTTPWMPTGATRDEFPSGWPWGAQALEGAALVALDLVRRAVNLCRSRNQELIDVRRGLGTFREAIHGDLARIRSLRRRETNEYLPQEMAALTEDLSTRRGDPAAPELQDWLEGWMEGRTRFETWLPTAAPAVHDPEQVARDVASRLVDARPVILRAAEIAEQSVGRETERNEWAALRERVERTVPGDQAATLEALVDLWIVQYTFAAGMPVLEQPIDFVHISSNTPNGLDERATVETKVAGIQLGHFGSFYKTSWRANDWMWGRLDGAMRLTQIVLNPARLRERVLDERLEGEEAVDWALGQVERLALPSDDPQTRQVLERRWAPEAASARKELAFLGDPEGPVPGSVPICATAIARRIQVDILRSELLQVAGAVEAAHHEGAGVSAAARRFADGVASAAGVDGRVAPQEVERLFRLCRVGEERITDEAGSDLFTTTSTQALAVGIAAASGSKSGLGPLRGVLRSVRSLFLGLYVLARSAVRGRGGFALATALLAIGGAIVAVGLVQDDMVENTGAGGFPSGALDWLAVGVLALGVVLMAVRAGLPLAAAYVLAAATLAWWPYSYVDRSYDNASGFAGFLYSVRVAIPIVVIVTASVVLGFVRRSPWWRTLAVAAVLAGLGVLADVAVREFRQPKLWLLLLVPAVTALLGFGMGRWTRTDRRERRRRPLG
jgi:patatin-related protein